MEIVLIHVPGISILMDKYMYVNRLNLNMHSSLWVMDVRLLSGMTTAENFKPVINFFQSINCKIIIIKTVGKIYVYVLRGVCFIQLPNSLSQSNVPSTLDRMFYHKMTDMSYGPGLIRSQNKKTSITLFQKTRLSIYHSSYQSPSLFK